MRNPSLRLNLKNMLDKEVSVKIRLYNTYLKGKISSFDQYSNLIMEDVVEYMKNEKTGILEEKQNYGSPVLLRGDSIIAITSISNK